MRRKNALSLRVESPSRGLVARLPSDAADNLSKADKQRVCTVAQNMRFEDGVMANAPGYSRVVFNTTILASCIAHWRFDEASAPYTDVVGHSVLTQQHLIVNPVPPLIDLSQVTGKIGKAAYAGVTTSSVPYLTGSLTLPAGSRSATFWMKADSVAISRILMVVPGMLIHQSGNQLIVDFAASLTSSAVLVAGAWTFVSIVWNSGTSTASLTVNTTTDTLVTSLSGFGGLSVFNPSPQASGLALDSLTVWSRAITGGEVITLYNAGTGVDYPFLNYGAVNLLFEGNQIGTPTDPLLIGTSTKLFSALRTYTDTDFVVTLTDLFTGTTASPGYNWLAADFYDKIILAQHNNVPQYWINGGSVTADVPGLAVNSTDQYSAVSDGYEKFDGVETFFGHAIYWKDDRLVWSDLNDFTNHIPVSSTISTGTFTTSGSFVQPAVGSTVSVPVNATATALFAGQYVRLINGTEYNYYSVTANYAAAVTAIVLKLLGTTGRTASAATITTAKTITTLDANEAGTTRVVGSNVNGPIFRVSQSGDNAYILKERSISSIQYVGQASGTFFIRTELTREGMVGRNAMVNLGNGQIVFLGHRELYSYAGGSTPTPVCRQYTRQLYEELDRTRLDQIVLHHRELRNEVWVAYPTKGGGQKMLIWNHVEDTATLDQYEPSLLGLTAAARVGWATDPTWDGLPDTETWDDLLDTITWDSLVTGGKEELTLLATGDGGLLLHGGVYSRAGQGYTSLGETMDFDLGDRAVFKYTDAIFVGLQLKVLDNQVRNLYVQVGGRTTMDASITWSLPKAIQVQGNANFTAQVNPGGSGRFLRLRFYSTEPNVQWRISFYELYTRAGGTV